MDGAAKQECESVDAAMATCSSLPSANNFSYSSSSISSLCTDPSVSQQNLVDLSYSDVPALPTYCRVMVESGNPEVHLLPSSSCGMEEFDNMVVHALSPKSSSGLDPPTSVVHVMNPFATQFGCPPQLRNSVSHSEMHPSHVKMHDYSLHSLPALEGSSLLGNAAVQAMCWSSSDECSSSRNDVVHVTSPLMPKMTSPSSLEFMRSFVNTLLPELKRIHSQSPSISPKEKLPAVRLAADMSLAISARGNNTWSQALLQELASSSSSEEGLRRKNNFRKSSTLRGRIYTSILRRSSRVGANAMCRQSQPHASQSNGSKSFACLSMLRDCSPSTLGFPAKCSHVSSDLLASLSGGSSHAVRCKTSSCVRRMRRVRHKRRSGLFCYVKILRNSRCMDNVSEKSPVVDRCNEASKAYTPSISKEHIESLGRLVPGGLNMDVPLLFQEAADYIVSLRMQVEALQSLSHFVSL